MLRAVLFCGALIALVGSTTYGQERTPPPPDARSEQAPQPSRPLPAEPEPSTPQQPNATPKNSVAGVYLCEGSNPDGSPYKGLVEIIAVDSTYLVHWVMADGVQVLGVGIRSSDTLAVSYYGGTPAVVLYQIQGDKLVGEWTMGGAEGKLDSETLTRMPEQPRERQRRRPERSRPSGESISI